MHASIIIITKNQRTFLEKSLPMLMVQDLEGAFEVIVVDSGSVDGAKEFVEGSGVRLIEIAAASFGYALAYNTGMRAAQGEFLVRLSGDAIPLRRDWLRHLLIPFQDSKVIATWGTQVLPVGITSLWEHITTAYYCRTRFRRRYTRPTNVLGSNMAVRGVCWQQSPFDETLSQAEDYAWTTYWYRRGFAGFAVPDAPVLHGHDLPLGHAIYRSLKQTALQFAIRTGWMGAR